MNADAIGTEAGIVVSVWAIEGVDLYAEHPWPEARYVTCTTDPFWTSRPGRYTAAIMGQRWLDLWLAAEQVVVASGDKQHFFVEGFEPLDSDTLDLWLGS
jgi:hypothetical protein